MLDVNLGLVVDAYFAAIDEVTNGLLYFVGCGCAMQLLDKCIDYIADAAGLLLQQMEDGIGEIDRGSLAFGTSCCDAKVAALARSGRGFAKIVEEDFATAAAVGLDIVNHVFQALLCLLAQFGIALFVEIESVGVDAWRYEADAGSRYAGFVFNNFESVESHKGFPNGFHALVDLPCDSAFIDSYEIGE